MVLWISLLDDRQGALTGFAQNPRTSVGPDHAQGRSVQTSGNLAYDAS